MLQNIPGHIGLSRKNKNSILHVALSHLPSYFALMLVALLRLT